jgi:hypothetical protein
MHLLLYLDCLVYDFFDDNKGWVVYDNFDSLTYKGKIYDSNNLKNFLDEILSDTCQDYTVELCFTDQDWVEDLEITCINFTFYKPAWSRDPRDNV